MHPETRYAKSEGAHIAYQVFGSGSVDLVFVPGFVSHIDNYWDEPNLRSWLEALGRFARVIMFDKRGTGLSDRVADLPGMDERLDDVRAVMDAAGVERAAVLGVSEGGSLAAVFAATHPERCTALVLYGAFAQFGSWFESPASLEEMIDYIDTRWGSGESLARFAPTMVGDWPFTEWWGRFERLGADPGAAITLMRMNSQIDVTDVLPVIHVPTLVLHRTGDVTVDVAGGRFLAEQIPDAHLVELSGSDHLAWIGGNSMQIVDEIAQFLTGAPSPAPVDRVLATVLFTDIVDSTPLAQSLGDGRWRDLLHDHDSVVRAELARFRGTEVKRTGDGFAATFDAPARAIRCALAVADGVRRLGIEIRAGIHTGEIHVAPDDIEGIAVHIAARVAGVAGAGQVVVSRTVRDLIEGSGISLEDHGTHSLKGVAGQWQLFLARA